MNLGNPLDALPPSLRELVMSILDGRCQQFVYIAEMQDGNMKFGWETPGNDSSRFAILGAMTLMQWDIMNSRFQMLGEDDDADSDG